MQFTIEIYKADSRKKEGKRLIECVEVDVLESDVLAVATDLVADDAKLTFEIHETYREVRNIMSGKIVKEHYKTPYSCSVASETYWCS